MAGQFSDTGSKYALEALTGRQALNLAGNSFTITTITAGDVGYTSTPISRSGWQTLTLGAQPAGILPGATVILTSQTTAASNTAYTVANVNYANSQISIQTGNTLSAGTLYVMPQAKTTYIALCTAQPLDNNYYNVAGLPGVLQIQEYAATGYARQAIAWSAVTEPNSGSASIFVGTGQNINGTSTAAPVLTPGSTTNLTVSNIVVSGSAGNPPYVATVTYTSGQAVAVGDLITIGGTWTGGTGALNAGTYTITSVPSYGTFTFGTNQTTITGNATSPAAVGTYTSGGTILLQGPYNITFSTYNTVVNTGTANPAAHNLVVGSTVNIIGTTTSAGVLDQINATIVAVPTLGVTGTTAGQFTVAAQTTGTAAATTNISFAASSTTVLPGSYRSSGTTAIKADYFVTYLPTTGNSYIKSGDTVIISGATTTTSYNRTTQVFYADASTIVIYDGSTTSATAVPTGTISIARVGAVTVGGLIQGPTSGTLTFGAFTANTGATITHAALVSTPTTNTTVAAGTIPVAGNNPPTLVNGTYVTFTTSAAHNLAAGYKVYITGLLPASFNGLYDVLSAPTTTTFTIANTTTSGTSVTQAGTVVGAVNGELLAWWALDTPRTPATNDQVTIGTNQLSLYVN